MLADRAKKLSVGKHHLASASRWRTLFTAWSFSSLGDQICRIAVLAKAGTLGATPTELAWVTLLSAIPPTAVSPIVGAFSDRGRGIRWLILAELLRAGICVGLVAAQSVLSVLMLSFLFGFGAAIYRPVEASLEVEMIASEKLLAANGLRVVVSQALMLLSPAITALLMYRNRSEPSITLASGAFVVAAILFIHLQTLQGTSGSKSANTKLEVSKALFFFLSTQELRAIIVAFSIVLLLLGMQPSIMYASLAVEQSLGNQVYASMLMTLALGSILGGLVFISKSGSYLNRLRTLFIVLFVDGVALFELTLTHHLIVRYVCMFIMGFISAAFAAAIRVQLQQRSPPEKRGRIFGWLEALRGPLEITSIVVALLALKIESATAVLRYAALLECLAAVICLSIISYSQNSTLRSQLFVK